MILQKLPFFLSAGLLLTALTLGSATAQQTETERADAALAFAQCMRDNGYAEFPDPTPDGDIRFQINRDSAPRFEAAAAACQHLAPEGMRGDDISPESLEALIKLAQCMRENGVPDFPDPSAEGGFNLQGVSTGPDDPRIAMAMGTCRAVAGGAPIRIGG